jgi:hypothetical protein
MVELVDDFVGRCDASMYFPWQSFSVMRSGSCNAVSVAVSDLLLNVPVIV